MKKVATVIVLSASALLVNAQEREQIPVDEWVTIAESSDGEVIVNARKDKVWQGSAAWFQMEKRKEIDTVLYHADCQRSKMFMSALITHDRKGNVKREVKGKEWSVVYPGTLAEKMHEVICQGTEKIEEMNEEIELEKAVERRMKKEKQKQK